MMMMATTAAVAKNGKNHFLFELNFSSSSSFLSHFLWFFFSVIFAKGENEKIVALWKWSYKGEWEKKISQSYFNFKENFAANKNQFLSDWKQKLNSSQINANFFVCVKEILATWAHTKKKKNWISRLLCLLLTSPIDTACRLWWSILIKFAIETSSFGERESWAKKEENVLSLFQFHFSTISMCYSDIVNRWKSLLLLPAW